MFWLFKKKKDKSTCSTNMIRNLYHPDIQKILSEHLKFYNYIQETTDFDPYNYSNNLNFLFHLYAAELIRLNKEIETMKERLRDV